MSRTGSCFVISPIGDADHDARGEAGDVIEFLVKPALTLVKDRTGVHLTATRSDQSPVVGEIVQDVIDRIIHDDVIIAVLFNSNPNAYYELGVAHSAGRRVVLLKKKEEKWHFDIRNHSMIEYTWRTLRDDGPDRAAVVRELADAIERAILNPRDDKVFNKYDPLARHFLDLKILNKFAEELNFEEYSRFFDVKAGMIGLMGISLHYFTRGDVNWTLSTGEKVNFPTFLQSKVLIDGCDVTLAIMDEANPALPQMLHRQGDADTTVVEDVRNEIRVATARWEGHIANVAQQSKDGNGGTMRLVKVRRGMIYRRMSITDHGAIVTPYFFDIGTNGGGPAVRVKEGTSLYHALRADLKYLVEQNATTSVATAAKAAAR